MSISNPDELIKLIIKTAKLHFELQVIDFFLNVIIAKPQPLLRCLLPRVSRMIRAQLFQQRLIQ